MISNNTYEEVYKILSLMDKKTVMKIPIETLNFIKEKRNPNFITKINKNDIFNEQNISEEAADILCFFEYNYWMDEFSKNKVERIIRMQKIEKENEKSKRYNQDSLFRKVKINSKITVNENRIVIYNESIFKKIWTKVLNSLKKFAQQSGMKYK